MEFEPETILKDRYRIIHLLGRGGMGAVYLAYDQSLEHYVAIKINHLDGESNSNQFLKEAHLLASLRHPNLPKVIDYFIHNENQLLVMDYVPGNDLGSLINNEGPQPFDRVVKWAIQLGSALSYLHGQKPPIVHCDIKPDNIKLTDKDDVILVDFGIAKAIDVSQSITTGSHAFTSGYAPPEQYGAGRTGAYSDQYGLAATIYHLLTGKIPPDSVSRTLNDDQLLPIYELRPDLPVHVQQVIERAMAIRSGDRFTHVDEFIQSLADANYKLPTSKTVIGGTQILQNGLSSSVENSKDVEQSYEKSGWQHRRSAVIVGGVIVLILFLLGISFMGYLTLRDRITLPSATVNSLGMAKQQQDTHIAATQNYISPTFTTTVTSTPTASPTFTSTQTFTSTITPTPTITSTLKPVGNGKMIAFVSDRADDSTLQIWLMRIGMDSSGQVVAQGLTQLTYDNRDKEYPAWSPDGTKLLYVAQGENKDWGKDIWMIDVTQAGYPPIDISQESGDEIEPAWSPDAKTIAYTGIKRADGIRQIYFMDADGSNKRIISYSYEQFSEFSPMWSSDMQFLIHLTDKGGHQTLVLRKKIDNFSTRSSVNPNLEYSELSDILDLCWSSDGKQIVYTKLNENTKDIMTIKYDGRWEEIILLTKNSHSEYHPNWSPDMQWIVFTSEREDKNPEIYVMTSTGLMQINLSNSPGRDYDPVWQP